MGIKVSMAELQAVVRMNFAEEGKDLGLDTVSKTNYQLKEKSRAKTILVASSAQSTWWATEA